MTQARALALCLHEAGLDDRDLDEWVIEHSQHDASLVNNGGLERQVAYLLEHGDSPQKILDAFGLNGTAVGARELEGALRQCSEALRVLAEHPAFAGEAPEFNEGGIGYEARQHAERLLTRRRQVHGH